VNASAGHGGPHGRAGRARPGAGRRAAADRARPWCPPLARANGARHSYGSLGAGLEPRLAAELADAHLRAIRRIAAALAAHQRGDHAETARHAAAAARLCGEIGGLWPAGAVEITGRT
jgi:hypothetical protein